MAPVKEDALWCFEYIFQLLRKCVLILKPDSNVFLTVCSVRVVYFLHRSHGLAHSEPAKD